MLGYFMVGTRDLDSATRFYDTVLKPLGLARDVTEDTYVGYSAKDAPENPEFYVTKPYNKQPASVGNGTMIALAAESRELVDKFHASGITSGGTDEGKPGPRPADSSIYYAYIRDLDGNKICAFCDKV
jgi:catechol 2,3-dioxygenase-like lactoylglutathione lyase family enzyme